MAKGKKSSGNNYTSKGERNNVSRSYSKAERRERSLLEQYANKMKAFKDGRTVYITIPHPNKNETNKRFIRVDAKTIWTKMEPYRMKLEG